MSYLSRECLTLVDEADKLDHRISKGGKTRNQNRRDAQANTTYIMKMYLSVILGYLKK